MIALPARQPWGYAVGNPSTESVVDASPAWLEALGYAVPYGPESAPGKPCAKPSDPNCHNIAPKTLISGELRVRGLGQQVEEATA